MRAPKPRIDYFGDIVWRNLSGDLHRDDDKPARIYSHGTLEWLIDGKLHRDGNKPAIVSRDGLFWYTHGVWKKHESTKDQ